MKQVKILVVEDNSDINHILCRYLEGEGYQTVGAFSGTEAKLLLTLDAFNLILLDLMIPGISGEDLLIEIRKKEHTPVIVISAKSGLEDKVRALKNGADDYITKPFEKDEVLARVDAVLRRSWDRGQGSLSLAELNDGARNLDPCPCSAFVFKQLTLKPASREVYVQGNMLSLTSHEFDILSKLLQFPDRVFTKAQLYQDIWKSGYYGEDNTINVHISNLRKKIKEFDDTSYIKTVWGIGFKIDNE